MATTYSLSAPAAVREEAVGDRQARRRRQTIDEALDHAVAIMTEEGVGALTVSEVARRMGRRAPSLYKYFDSLHAMYDALFGRGLAESSRVVGAAVDGVPPGVDAIRVCARATVRWCVENPALAQLLYWRVVPGFEPTPSTFTLSHDQLAWMREMFDEAVRRRQLSTAASGESAMRLISVLMSGLITQQMANDPGGAYADGVFTSLTDEALDLFIDHYRRTDGPKGRA